MDEIFCTDLTSFVKEEVILEDTGSTSSSDVDVPSPISESEEIVNVRKYVKSNDIIRRKFRLFTDFVEKFVKLRKSFCVIVNFENDFTNFSYVLLYCVTLSVEKRRNSLPSHRIFSREIIAFTKFLSKMSESKFPQFPQCATHNSVEKRKIHCHANFFSSNQL